MRAVLKTRPEGERPLASKWVEVANEARRRSSPDSLSLLLRIGSEEKVLAVFLSNCVQSISFELRPKYFSALILKHNSAVGPI